MGASGGSWTAAAHEHHAQVPIKMGAAHPPLATFEPLEDVGPKVLRQVFVRVLDV
jgi:hypothetical protein